MEKRSNAFLLQFAQAKTLQDAEEGLLFVQEMIEYNKLQSQHLKTVPQVSLRFSIVANLEGFKFKMKGLSPL